MLHHFLHACDFFLNIGYLTCNFILNTGYLSCNLILNIGYFTFYMCDLISDRAFNILNFTLDIGNIDPNIVDLIINICNLALKSIFQLVSCFLSRLFNSFWESSKFVKIEWVLILNRRLNYQSYEFILFIKEKQLLID